MIKSDVQKRKIYIMNISPLNTWNYPKRLDLRLAIPHEDRLVNLSTGLHFTSEEELNTHINLLTEKLGWTFQRLHIGMDGCVAYFDVGSWVLSNVAKMLPDHVYPLRIGRIDDYKHTTFDFQLGPTVGIVGMDRADFLRDALASMFDAAFVKVTFKTEPTPHYLVKVALDETAVRTLPEHFS